MTTGAGALPQIYLKPGELLVTHEPSLVTTILGSCVAVTFFSPRLRLAAICHAMLPRPKHGGPDPEQSGMRFKYLSEAIPYMAEKFARLGISPPEVDVKLFGGGNVIGGTGPQQPERRLGSVNVQVARDMLEAASFQIRASNVGGERGRKILFDTSTGGVRHKHLPARISNTTP
jgi:chemotaxis protein CheD